MTPETDTSKRHESNKDLLLRSTQTLRISLNCHFLQIDIFAQPNPDPTFSKRLLSAMKEPPFNCTRECNGYTDKVC